jgi:hypothetical protein
MIRTCWPLQQLQDRRIARTSSPSDFRVLCRLDSRSLRTVYFQIYLVSFLFHAWSVESTGVRYPDEDDTWRRTLDCVQSRSRIKTLYRRSFWIRINIFCLYIDIKWLFLLFLPYFPVPCYHYRTGTIAGLVQAAGGCRGLQSSDCLDEVIHAIQGQLGQSLEGNLAFIIHDGDSSAIESKLVRRA